MLDYTTAVILTSKHLFKLGHIWMPTAITPLEDIAWTVAYKSLFLLFSSDPSNTFGVSSYWSLIYGQTRSGGTNLNLRFFPNADLNVIDKTEKCQRSFSANILAEFKSNPRSNHLVVQKFL